MYGERILEPLARPGIPRRVSEYESRRLQEVWSPMEGERDKDQALARLSPGLL